MRSKTIVTIGVLLVEPPWYWRMIGRQYWKGWRIRIERNGLIAESKPALKPPNPEDVSRATIETYDKILETEVK